MTDSDIYQIVGKAYCDGLNQGMEKSAAIDVASLKSIFRAADKGKLLNVVRGGSQGISSILERIGFNDGSASRFGQLYNALTNAQGLGRDARWALTESGKIINENLKRFANG